MRLAEVIGKHHSIHLAAIQTPRSNTLNPGLCIAVVGENAKPYDAKHDPKPILQTAFAAAGINANCGSGSAAGNYKLFVVVGHRPLIVGYKPVLVRLGQWIMSLGQ